MFSIPRRYSHFVFAVIQSGLTSLVAAGIASFPSITHWLVSWLVAWLVLTPIVVLAAPGDKIAVAGPHAGMNEGAMDGLLRRPDRPHATRRSLSA
jgi:hypothetical protein